MDLKSFNDIAQGRILHVIVGTTECAFPYFKKMQIPETLHKGV